MKPLAALAFPVEATRGRRFPELPHKYRNDFQRDRDRIAHSRAFRRLENKTQVFSAAISDHFRNRLTHTIEVTLIARTVAVALGLNEDLTEALALVHDVGHPPFAHAGEFELNRQMRRFGDSFNHNVHGLRVVDAFEQSYARFPGLNLTFEVREGIVKHSRDLTPGADPDLEEYLPALRPPLEAQLIDLADEIAYDTADLDDGYSSHMFAIADVRAAVPEFAEIHDQVENHFPGAPERLQFLESERVLMDRMVNGLVNGTIEAARTAAVRDYEEVRYAENRLAAFNAGATDTTRRIKSFMHAKVYNSEPLYSDRKRSAGMIADLFDYFLREPGSLPENYVEELNSQPLHRVVCDYIAGMTDRYFMRCYQEARLTPR